MLCRCVAGLVDLLHIRTAACNLQPQQQVKIFEEQRGVQCVFALPV